MRHKKNCTCFTSAVKATEHHFPILKKILAAGKTRRKKLFETVDNCLINFIGSCCRGVLKEHIKLPEKEYSKLVPYSADLQYLADKKTRLKDKRSRLIKKGGGFLSIILPALASAVFSLFGRRLLNI